MTVCLRTSFIQFLFSFFVVIPTSSTNCPGLFWDFAIKLEIFPSLGTLIRFYISKKRLSLAFWSRVPANKQIKYKWKAHEVANFHFYRNRTSELGVKVVPAFTMRFFLRLKATACLNCQTVVVAWLYLSQQGVLYDFHTMFSAFFRSCPVYLPVLFLSVCSGIQAQTCLFLS